MPEEEGPAPGPFHEPVMLAEVLAALEIKPGSIVVDGTLGSAGHACEMAKALDGTGVLIGLDRDPRMLERGRERLLERLSSTGSDIHFFPYPCENIGRALREAGGLGGADAILLDLGYNSLQMDDPRRGFSMRADGPLDARYNPEEGGETMADIVNNRSEKELAAILRELGDERYARQIARRIVRRRNERPFTRTVELAEEIEFAYPPRERHGRIHSATRSFMALRICANDELGAVARGLDACLEALAPGGRLAVLSFHSGEDKIVKKRFRAASEAPEDPSNPYSVRSDKAVDFELVTRRPVACSAEEAERNPRARSAKLRVIRRKEEVSA